MTQEDKELILRDLCARLPYNVLVHIYDIDVCDYDNYLCEDYLAKFRINSIQIKPYLRPMSSMTEEELHELAYKVLQQPDLDLVKNTETLDIRFSDLDTLTTWLNAHHFDFRNLIERGLAIDCTGLNIY